MLEDIEDSEISLKLTAFLAVVTAAKTLTKEEIEIIFPLFIEESIGEGLTPSLVNKKTEEIKGLMLETKKVWGVA